MRLLRGDEFGFRKKKAGFELLQASHLTSHQPYALVVVVIMLMMLMGSMASVVVRPPRVVRRSVIWITTVIAVVAPRVIPISRVSIVAVAIRGITEADPDSSDPD